MNKIKIVRTRNFEYISYLPLEIIKRELLNETVLHYAYVFHDKDMNDDNSLKQPHYHIVITYVDAKTLPSRFKITRALDKIYCKNTRVEAVENLRLSLRYLIHLDDKDKYQYSLKDISFDSGSYLRYFEDNAINTTEEILEDILAEKSLRYLVRKYGRDLVINYNKYCAFARMLYSEERHLEELPQSDVPPEIEERILEERIQKFDYKKYI